MQIPLSGYAKTVIMETLNYFETSRLLFRQFSLADADLVYQLNSDAEVTRYTLDPMVSRDQALQVLRDVILPQYAQNGFGRWAVHRKDNAAFIGWCGLKFRPEMQEVDLGYRFAQSAWGQGFATESAAAALQQGFEKFRLQRIVGRALPENLASIKVLQKIGMKQIEDQVVEDLLHKTFEAVRPVD